LVSWEGAGLQEAEADIAARGKPQVLGRST
jgi:hypothetical protein